MSLLFNHGFFLESDVNLEDCPKDGLVKQGLIRTKVLLETTFEFDTIESDDESSSHRIYSSTSLSKDAQNELVWSESCPHLSGRISSIILLFGGPEFKM